jgi:hypothetical protein
MSRIDQLPYVEAELNYLGSTADRPRYYAYERTENDPPTVMPYEPHRMQIHDLRPIQHELSLDTQGFALGEHRSAVRDFWDDNEVRRVYYPEAEALSKASPAPAASSSSIICSAAASPA